MNASRFPGFRNFLACLVFIVVLVSHAPAAAPQWMEVKSPHFSVYTDAGEKRGREVAMRFEQMRAVFGALLTKANVNIPVPLQVVAFRNTKELRQFSPIWKGKPTQVAGLFQGGEDRSFIMLDMSTEDPWQVVFHEYAHQLMNGTINMQLDAWYEEGFAVYFSSIQVDGKEARVGNISNDEYEIFRTNSLIKIADLFKVRQYSETYNESGSRRNMFYEESGMVLRYLYDQKLNSKLPEYFELKLNRNVPVEEAIQKAFGMSAAQFDKEFGRYVSAGSFRYYKIPNPGNVDSSTFTAAPVSDADANAVLADIHLHSLDYQDKAVAEFEEILKSDPNNSAALRGLGYANLRKRDFNKAGEYFQKASKGNSKDPRVHYYSALALSRQGTSLGREVLPEVTKELETAIALDPSFADSYSLLAFAQAYGGDPAKGLATMQQAIRLSPRNETYQLNLASMYMNNRKADEAIALLRALERSSNQMVATQASRNIEGALQMKEALNAQATWEKSREAQDEAPRVEEPPSKVETEKPEVKVANGPMKSVKGTLTGVDCSKPPFAVFTVVEGTKTWKLKVPGGATLQLLGADEFSCAWANKKVVAKFRVSGEAEGSLIFLDFR